MKNEMYFLRRSCDLFPIWCFFLHALLLSPATHAQLCTGALIGYTEEGNSANQSPDVCGTFCHTPILSATEFTVTPPGCDPKVSTCGVTASTAMEYPGNHQNFSAPGFSWATLILTDAADGFIGQCGTPFGAITQSLGTATFGGTFDCAGLEANPTSATFKLKAISCFMIGCETQTIGTIDLGGALDCTETTPPLHGCGEGACGSSCFGPGGGGDGGGGGSGDGGGGGSGGSSAAPVAARGFRREALAREHGCATRPVVLVLPTSPHRQAGASAEDGRTITHSPLLRIQTQATYG